METVETKDAFSLDKIRTDGGTQARAGLDEGKVAEYQQMIEEESKIIGNWPFKDAIELFYDGSDYWLADGFHRIEACRRATWLWRIKANIHQGTRRDAILFACGANATHGLPRTADDKRRAVETLLRDEEWGAWSDREIARRCKVSHTFVAKIRSGIDTGNGFQYQSQERVFVHPKTGKETVMNTTKIGGGPIYSGLTEEEIGIVNKVRGHSCVYVTSNKGAYKIGYTTDLASRYTTTQKPPTVQLVHAFVCSGRDAEKELHRLFANKKISGEWFNLTGNDLEWLLSLTDESEIPNTANIGGGKSVMDDLAYTWLSTYTDDKGRTWRDLEDNQVHHANSPCYQAFVKEFPDLTDPKLYLKRVMYRLRDEAQNAIIQANNKEFFERVEKEYIQHREDAADPDGRKPPLRCPRCHAGKSSVLIGSDHWRCTNCGRNYDHTGKMPEVKAYYEAKTAEPADYPYTAEIEQYVQQVDAGAASATELARRQANRDIRVYLMDTNLELTRMAMEQPGNEVVQSAAFRVKAAISAALHDLKRATRHDGGIDEEEE